MHNMPAVHHDLASSVVYSSHFAQPKLIGYRDGLHWLCLLQVLLRLAEDSRFVDGVAGEPDYEEPVLRKAHHILTSKQLGEYEHAARLDKLIAQVSLPRLQMPVHHPLSYVGPLSIKVPMGDGAEAQDLMHHQLWQCPQLWPPHKCIYSLASRLSNPG